MGRGTPIGDLVPYNTKLKPETKDKLDALAKVLRLDGQRELLEKLLAVYEEHYPQDVARADELLAVLNSIDRPNDPLAGKGR